MPKYAHPRTRTSGGPGELFSGNAARLVARLRPMAGRAASQVRDATHLVGLGVFFWRDGAAKFGIKKMSGGAHHPSELRRGGALSSWPTAHPLLGLSLLRTCRSSTYKSYLVFRAAALCILPPDLLCSCILPLAFRQAPCSSIPNSNPASSHTSNTVTMAFFGLDLAKNLSYYTVRPFSAASERTRPRCIGALHDLRSGFLPLAGAHSFSY